MPITSRVIEHFRVPKDAFTSSKECLDSTSSYIMVNLLHQLGQVSEFASEIMDDLYQQSTAAFGRIKDVSKRVVSFDKGVGPIERTMKTQPASVFYSSAKPVEFRRQEALLSSLFDPSTRPIPIQKSRSEALPPPNLTPADTFFACIKDSKESKDASKEPKSCMKEYSDPTFFFSQWLLAETEKQTAMLQQNAKAREARRKNKKQTEKQEAPKQQLKIEKRVYSALGAEFASSPSVTVTTSAVRATNSSSLLTNQSAFVISVTSSRSAVSTVPSISTSTVSSSSSPSYPPPSPSPSPSPPKSPAPTPKTVLNTSVPTAPPPVVEDDTQRDQPTTTATPSIPEAPPPQQEESVNVSESETSSSSATSESSSSVPTAPVPEAPTIDSSVPEVPEAPSVPIAPEAPPIDMSVPETPTPKASSSSSSKRPPAKAQAPSLLDAIRGGAKLRKPTQAPVAKKVDVNSRDDMLFQIRKGAALKKTTAQPKVEKKQPPAKGMGGIMEILARRAAIKGDSEGEEGGEDNWDTDA
eukprot:TRINITY_DN6165_c0_g1_i1.p1 TRINITY_DN6165_c0_g1~~TRINITY_DN6165_c0_g1_i1.p1  ORF type:complete len:525 (+),score=120.87 TRINITY_DN6165_c0_g1_i1:48-1622(+)